MFRVIPALLLVMLLAGWCSGETPPAKPADLERGFVEVTNLWPNRLIGDQFLPPSERFTHTNVRHFTRASPLLESGLFGPVRLPVVERVPVVWQPSPDKLTKK